MSLGYTPLRTDAIPAHHEKIRGLIEHFHFTPIAQVERACEQWARESKYMPTPADLIALMQGYNREQYDTGERAPHDCEGYVAFWNARMPSLRLRVGRNDQGLKTVEYAPPEQTSEIVTPAEAARLIAEMRDKYGRKAA